MEPEWDELTTLDMDPEVGPDVVFDLTDIHRGVKLPFEDESFHEIHAYDVLEHVGQQGDFEGFFSQWREYWRVLKPNGFFCASTPAWDSIWAWSDPGHTRIYSEGTLSFLQQREYALQVSKTAMTDYRSIWPHNFEVLDHKYEGDAFAFILQKT